MSCSGVNSVSVLVVIGIVCLTVECPALNVDLSLNQASYVPGDRLVLVASVECMEDTRLDDVFIYVRMPHISHECDGRVYLPLKKYNYGWPNRADGCYGVPWLHDAQLLAGGYAFTLIDGEITEVLPMVTGIGTYALVIEVGDESGSRFDTLASVEFSFHSKGGSPSLSCFPTPDIHTAFQEVEGSIIVSTGTWYYSNYYWGYVGEYCDGGLYRIRGDTVQQLNRPDDMFILDGAVDSVGQTWVTYGEGLNWTHYYGKQSSIPNQLRKSQSNSGYRRYVYPMSPARVDSNRRIGVLDGHGLVSRPELTEAVPGEFLVAMTSDSDGRVFLLSWEAVEGPCEDFLCWWDWRGIDSLEIISIDGILGKNASTWRYPKFGPDGLVYLLFYTSPHYAVLSLDPDTAESRVYSCQDYPLDCDIDFFYVDPVNNLWFGSQSCLVGFDGESWTDYRSEDGWFLFDNIIQMEYDDINDVYYMMTCESPDGSSHDFGLTLFCPSDLNSCVHICFPSFLSSFPENYLPTIFEGAQSVWWLSPPLDRYGIYSYDHRDIVYWDFRNCVFYSDWSMFEESSSSVYDPFGETSRFVGRTSEGQSFCVTGGRGIVIW